MNHYILPMLHKGQPDLFLLHLGSNDINNQIKDKINTEKLTEDIINISKSCIDPGLKKVISSIISSILTKNNITLTHIIRQVNDSLREQCGLNRFDFISNNNISGTHLWTDGGIFRGFRH